MSEVYACSIEQVCPEDCRRCGRFGGGKTQLVEELLGGSFSVNRGMRRGGDMAGCCSGVSSRELTQQL